MMKGRSRSIFLPCRLECSVSADPDLIDVFVAGRLVTLGMSGRGIRPPEAMTNSPGGRKNTVSASAGLCLWYRFVI